MCNKQLAILKCSFIAFLIVSSPILSSKTAASDVSKESPITFAENWINGIHTLEANFLQTTSHGKVAKGKIYILRPGLMLIDYASPINVKIYADGNWMIFVDYDLKEVNQVPLSATPARLLLNKNVRLSDKAHIMIQENENSYQFLLTRKDDPNEGLINLIFSKNPWQLRSWNVIDQQGIKTNFSLLAVKINQPINKNKLMYYAPDWAFE